VEFNKLDFSEFTRIQPESIGTAFITTNSRKARILTGRSANEWYNRFRYINKETLRYFISELEGIELEAYDIDPNYKNCCFIYSKQ
jgi:hypothetical protein